MDARSKDTTQAIVDGVIKFIAAGGFITTALVAPNVLQILDKPATKLFKHLDIRQQERELRRIIYYMKNRGLIKYEPRDYEHGIRLTKAGKDRLKKSRYSAISIKRPPKWDKKWRLVFFDIPESQRGRRNALIQKLKLLGFRQLQYSIWIYPFDCRAEIEAVCEYLNISRYVSYVELTYIDHERVLRRRFKETLTG